MKRKRIDIITLGCSKNLVDSEQLMRQLEEAGYSVTHDTENPEGEISFFSFRLFPLFSFRHIVYNLTLDESFQVPHRNPHQPDTGFFRGPGDMRCNEAVLRRQQGVGILGSLGRKHLTLNLGTQCVG